MEDHSILLTKIALQITLFVFFAFFYVSVRAFITDKDAISKSLLAIGAMGILSTFYMLIMIS